MRILAGSLRGRRILSVPKTENVKPISARIRQSVFDIIRPYVTGSVFLDLYAGVGTVGLEALSRGAASVVFVERAGICVKTIEKNMDNLGVRDRAKALKADVLSGLKWLEHFSDYKGYDIVFLSPPYRDGENLPLSYTSRTLSLAAGDGIAGPGCLFIAQHHRNERVEVPAGLARFRQEKYGDTLVDFFRIA